MRAHDQIVISAINRSPYNRGLDGACWLAFQENKSIVFENGDVMLFDHQGDYIFDIHFLFDTARGRSAMNQAKVGFEFAFLNYKARALTGLTPIENRKARMFNRLIGCKSAGLRETPFGQCEKFVITRQMWKAN